MCVQLRTLTGQSRTEVGKLSAEVTDLQRANVDLQRRHVQFQHELRRKDREFERLQVDISARTGLRKAEYTLGYMGSFKELCRRSAASSQCKNLE